MEAMVEPSALTGGAVNGRLRNLPRDSFSNVSVYLGAMPRTAIVVPGHGTHVPTGYRISSRCRRLVAAAESLALRLEPAAVVFTGWSPLGGPSEAEQMRDAWRGPNVELVVEPTATVTAARTLPLLLDRGIERAIVVCAPFHYVRTRYFFRRLYAARGIETHVRTVPVAPSPRALAWELAALPWARRQLRRALAELERAR
jgi:DUF218 domain-containing protein